MVVQVSCSLEEERWRLLEGRGLQMQKTRIGLQSFIPGRPCRWGLDTPVLVAFRLDRYHLS